MKNKLLLYLLFFLSLPPMPLQADSRGRACQNSVVRQIPLGSPRRVSASNAKKKVEAAYLGILDDSSAFLVKASLIEALDAGDPFQIEGKGDLWPETSEALAKLRNFVDGHRRKDLLRKALLEKLKERLEDNQQRTPRSRKQAGKAPPLSIVTPLVDAPTAPMGLALSPDGKTLITAGEKGEIVVYYAKTRLTREKYRIEPIVERAKFFRHGDYLADWPIFPIAFTENSRHFVISLTTAPYLALQRFVTHTGERTHKVDEIRRQGWRKPIHTCYLEQNAIRISKNGKYIAVGGGGGDYNAPEGLWNIAKRSAIAAYMPRFSASTSGYFSPDGVFYFSAAGDFPGLRVYHLPSETELVATFNSAQENYDQARGRSYQLGLQSVAESAKPGTFLAQIGNTEYGNGALQLVRVDYTKLEAAMTGKLFTNDKARLIDTTGKRRIEFAQKGALKTQVLNSRRPPRGEELEGSGLRYSPDGKYLVSYFHSFSGWNDEGKVVLRVHRVGRWNTIVAELGRKHPAQLKKWDFSPDGKYFVTLAEDNKLRVFRVDGSIKFEHLITLGGKKNPILNFAVNHDSSRIFLVENENLVVRNFYEEGK